MNLLRRWGELSQILMLSEEATELSLACHHLLRKTKERIGLEQLAEEIADTQIMMDEITYFLHIEEKVRTWRRAKLERLEKLVQGVNQ